LHLTGEKPRRDLPASRRPADIRYLAIVMRNEMKVIALSIAICALSQTAMAQTPECKSIAAANDRLACYDKAGPPAKPALRPAAAKPDPSGYVDTISAEDALMNARLKNICRGC
jgi:hypothetical protein